MNCECLKRINKELEEHNIRIALGLQLVESTTEKGWSADLHARIIVATEKIDPKSRKKPPILYASFCPFCGKKIMEDAT